LAVEIVYDRPDSVASLAEETLEGWGMTYDDALRVARSNLRDRTPGTFVPVAAGVYGSPWNDAYDSSRLLLVELISRLDVNGDPVALLPNRGALFITGSDDVEGLAEAAALAEPLLSEPRRETGRAFVRRDGVWQAFMPPADHAAYVPYRRMAYLTQAMDYNDQKQAIEQELREAGTHEDVFVGSLMLTADRETEMVVSTASWAEGVPTLMPRADFVSFVSGESDETRQIIRVPWNDAVEIVGDLMQRQDADPERWLVESFPDAARLGALGQRAVE
jgi:hypothetical protein